MYCKICCCFGDFSSFEVVWAQSKQKYIKMQEVFAPDEEYNLKTVFFLLIVIFLLVTLLIQ